MIRSIFPALLTVLIVLLGSDSALPATKAAAAKAKPVIQENPHVLNLEDKQLLLILNDPQNYFSSQFKVPESLKPYVGFWLKVYSKYSQYHTILHDRNYPHQIYEVVDSTDLFKKGMKLVALEISIKKRINKTLAAYHAAFKKLEKNPRHKFKAGEAGARILALWGRRTSKQWKVIHSQLRTQGGLRDRTLSGIVNAEPFFPAMEKIFKKFGVPGEITRLPLVESSFNLNAVSKANAVGVWQFLRESAQEYLIVDKKHKIDERMSPIKSTYAAAKMFKRNFRLLKDWGLSIIAYNHGPKNLIALKKKYSGKNIAALLGLPNKKSPLGFASKNFYTSFLAVLYAEKYKSLLFGIPHKNFPEAISIVRLSKSLSIFDISTKYKISLREIQLYNPDVFAVKKKLPAGTRIVIPRDRNDSLVLRLTQKEGRSIASEAELIEYIH